LNRPTLATIAGGAIIALTLGLPAGAQAAPSGIGSAQDTVNELENSGFKVVLNKMGVARSITARSTRCVLARLSPAPSKTAATW
jgi:hypothetical protein